MSVVRIAVNKHRHSSDLSSHVSVQQGGGFKVVTKDQRSHAGADSKMRYLASPVNTGIIRLANY